MTEPDEILWVVVAERDLLGIIDFIADDNPRTPTEVLQRIRDGTARLDHSPSRGRIVPDAHR